MKELIRCATMAPSAHNNQAWRFRLLDSGIQILLHRSKLLPALDPGEFQSLMGLGGAVEIICVAARVRGRAPAVTLFPDSQNLDVVAEIRLTAGAPSSGDEQALFGRFRSATPCAWPMSAGRWRRKPWRS